MGLEILRYVRDCGKKTVDSISTCITADQPIRMPILLHVAIANNCIPNIFIVLRLFPRLLHCHGNKVAVPTYSVLALRLISCCCLLVRCQVPR